MGAAMAIVDAEEMESRPRPIKIRTDGEGVLHISAPAANRHHPKRWPLDPRAHRLQTQPRFPHHHLPRATQPPPLSPRLRRLIRGVGDEPAPSNPHPAPLRKARPGLAGGHRRLLRHLAHHPVATDLRHLQIQSYRGARRELDTATLHKCRGRGKVGNRKALRGLPAGR